MAYIDVNGGNGHHTFRLTTYEESYNAETKQSIINYAATIRPITTGYDFNWTGQSETLTFSIDIGNKNITETFPQYDGSSTLNLTTGTVAIDRTEDDGNSVTCTFTFTDTTGADYTPGSCTSSFVLDNLTVVEIIRYIYHKIEGVWKKGIPYVKVNDVWLKAKRVFTKVNDTWKEVS